MSSRNGFLRLLLLNFCCKIYGLTCESTQILCRTDKCISIEFICDGDNDCGDRSDEAFCTEWMNTGCGIRGEAKCMRPGSANCVSMTDYCTASNLPCTGIVDPRICQMLQDGRLQDLSSVVLSTTEAPTTTTTIPTTTTPPPPVATNLDKTIIQGQMFVDSLTSTMSHPDCPMLFTRVGQHCFSLFYILKIGWGEAEKFCQTIGGELVSFGNNPEEITDFMKHMRESGQTNDFWTGGRYVNETEGWKWLSGDDSMEGFPF